MRRSYWVYSTGLLVVWAVLLSVVTSARGWHRAEPIWDVAAGFAIAWVSGTIARYIYPPPGKWTKVR